VCMCEAGVMDRINGVEYAVRYATRPIFG
jgi:hypothetical protein